MQFYKLFKKMIWMDIYILQDDFTNKALPFAKLSPWVCWWIWIFLRFLRKVHVTDFMPIGTVCKKQRNDFIFLFCFFTLHAKKINKFILSFLFWENLWCANLTFRACINNQLMSTPIPCFMSKITDGNTFVWECSKKNPGQPKDVLPCSDFVRSVNTISTREDILKVTSTEFQKSSFHRLSLARLTPCWSVLDVWKIKFGKLDFYSISNWIFANYTGSKNQVQNRLKIQFVQLDFSN